MKVLIVDQNINTKESLTLGLNNSKKEFAVFYANDGVDALSLLQEEVKIDLIISDLNLPRMGGISLLETLRKSKSTVSFILFSSEAPEKLSQISKSLQLSGWFLKSFSSTMELNTKDIIKRLEGFSDQLSALKRYESLKS